MLAAAASRLARPALTAVLSYWRRDWEATRRAAELKKIKSSGFQAQLEEKMAVVREQMEVENAQVAGRLKTVEAKWREAERRLVEFTGTAEEVERAAQERPARRLALSRTFTLSPYARDRRGLPSRK